MVSHRRPSNAPIRLALVAAALLPFACASGGDAGAPGDAASGVTVEAGTPEGASSDAPVDATQDRAPAPDVGAPTEASGAQDAGDVEAGDADLASDAASDAARDGGCPEGQILCGASCVDAADPTHCGDCTTVCASGICGTSVAADMSAQPPNWTFNGVAVWDSTGPSARLTTAKTELVSGTVVYNHPIVTDSFDASFAFRIGANGGGPYDGMGFMLEVNGPSALGSVGGGLGMAGLDGYGVELDIYDNGSCGDSNANHVGVDRLTSCGSGMLTSLFASQDLTGTVTLDDAQWHTATVQLAAGTLTVIVDAHEIGAVALTGFAPGTSYYYGFAGAIGGGNGSLGMQTEVKDVTVTFPTPRCL